MRVFNEYFWGLFLILVGGIFLVKHIFNLDIPVGRTIIGVLLVYLGLSILFAGGTVTSRSDIIFGNRNIHVTDLDREYNIIFGSGTIDLSDAIINGQPGSIKINTIFSTGTVIINRNQPLVIRSNAAFATATMPDHSTISFGNNTYKTGAAGEMPQYLEIESNTVFGTVRIVEE
jgi:hypothetical protein